MLRRITGSLVCHLFVLCFKKRNLHM
nr:unnamed protein product [Callosobruchus analis]CAI5818438.1 unnamed protein product [Callosobruchus analis]